MSPIFVALGPAIIVAIVGLVACYIIRQTAWDDGWDAAIKWMDQQRAGDMGQMEDWHSDQT